MKILDILILLLLIIALFIGISAIWFNLPIENRPYKSFSANFSAPIAPINASGKIVQFYPNMRYEDRTISYSLDSACTETKWVNIERAFEILSERTVLSFYHSSSNPEIRVLCSEISPESKEKGHFIAGEGGPSEIINTTNFAVILNGRISLYRDERCDEPKIALHEILHALGFDHYNNSKSILYPVTGCDQQIDQEIIDIINKLYSLDSLPDLAIESINANRTGRYLNFNISISNIGLADSKEARLNVYVLDKKIANFTIGGLEIGTKSLLSVQNVRLPSGSENLVFAVESDDANELNLANNRAEISVI